MTMKAVLLLTALATLATPALAAGQRRGERQEVFDAARSGRLLPLPEIERRVLPTMAGAQYIGVDVDLDTGIYTLKFLRDGLVIWVAVDGRSGQIVGRTGR